MRPWHYCRWIPIRCRSCLHNLKIEIRQPNRKFLKACLSGAMYIVRSSRAIETKKETSSRDLLASCKLVVYLFKYFVMRNSKTQSVFQCTLISLIEVLTQCNSEKVIRPRFQRWLDRLVDTYTYLLTFN